MFEATSLNRKNLRNERLVKAGRPMAMRRVRRRADIFPVFRDLFTPVELKR